MGKKPMEIQDKPKQQRSVAYPGFNLESSIESVKTLRLKLGDGPYSREQAAIELGYKGVNGVSATKIAACVHFGLLDRTNNTYSLSELAKSIIASTSENEKLSSIVEAIKTPVLFSKIINAYDNQSLPLSLNNILDRQYGIISKKSKTVAKLFKESAEFAGILHNGVISSTGRFIDTDTETLNKNTVAEAKKSEKESYQQEKINNKFINLVIPGTEVILRLPEKYIFNLSMGDFKKSISSLQDDIQKIDQNLLDINTRKEDL